MLNIYKKLLVLSLLILSLPVHASASNERPKNQLFVLDGPIYQNGDTSNTWEVAYDRKVNHLLGYSIAYINEGHFPGQFRDGFALQLDANSPLFLDNNLGASVGVGPYLYFNTTFPANETGNDYQNQHGLGLSASAHLVLYTFNPVLFELTFNHIQVGGSNNTNAVLLGLGYNLDALKSPDAKIYSEHKHELMAMLGSAEVNGRNTLNSLAYDLEYRYLSSRHTNLSFNYINEGSTSLTDRQGIAGLFWLNQPLDRVSLGAGIGPYFVDEQKNNDWFAGIIGISANYFLTPRWFAHLEYNRVLTFNDRDSDLFLAGIGFSF